MERIKLIVIIPLKGDSQGPRLVQFILETEQEMERFANFYSKNNPTIAALLDVLLGRQKNQEQVEDKPSTLQIIQVDENISKVEK